MANKITDTDRGWKKIVASVNGAARAAHVGIQGDEAAQSRLAEGGSISNVELAVTHEFGVPEIGIPERSFIRSTFDDNEHTYARMLAQGGKKILAGEMNQDQVVGLIGEKMVSDMKQKINEGIDPPNTLMTQLLKGSSTPLIDTGAMKGAITYKVTDTNGS